MALSSIKIDSITRIRLQDFKKKYGSYDKIITSFLDYFEVTGVKPNEVQSSPISIVKSRADATISLMRGIEKKSVKRDQETHNFLELIYNKISGEKEGVISEEEGKLFLEKIENLEVNLKQKEAEISELKLKLIEISNQNKAVNNVEEKNNYKEIRAQINEIISEASISIVKKEHYQISKILFDSNTDTIINLTK